MTKARSVVAGLALVMIAAYVGSVGLGRALDEASGRRPADQLALPSPKVAKRLAVGFDAALADLYFIRSLQYYAQPRNARDHYRYLTPLLEIVAELDHRFREPLLWGGVVTPMNLGRETWINTGGSTRLLRLGTERFPEDWRFNVFLAYNLSTFHHRYVEAAEALKGAIGKPGAPSYLPALAARLYASGGDLDTAASFAEAMAEGTGDPEVRSRMEERRLDIATEQVLRRIDDAVRAYHEAKGRWPVRVWDLVEAGFLDTIPGEPRGGVFYLDDERHIALSTLMPDRLVIYRADRPYRADAVIGDLAKPKGDEPESTTP